MKSIQVKENFSLNWSRAFVHTFNPKHIHWEKNYRLDPETSRPSQKLIDVDQYKNLIQTKDKINIYKNRIYIWNKWSRLINPYEKIGTFSQLPSNVSISRAFFKLLELLYITNFKEFETSLHCCEAPGGFVSASIYINSNVEWKAQTLYTDNALTVNKTLDPNNWIRNGNGDICIEHNLRILRKTLGKKVDLITSDGGFDVSMNPNCQEQLSQKLIFGEILAALMCQKIGGTFICKCFDIHTKPTFQFLLLLKLYFKEVLIIKPRTSRITNAEKYIVAKGFKGTPEEDIDHLLAFLTEWNHDNHYLRDLGLSCESLAMKKLKKYNTLMAKKQSKCVLITLKYIHINAKKIMHLLETIQNKKALAFCYAFNLIKKERKCKHNKENSYPLKGYLIPHLVYCDTCMLFIEKEK